MSTDTGGLLTLHVQLLEEVKQGHKLATIRDIFGEIVKEYFSPQDGIAIGRSTSPVNQSGGRILHLGLTK